MKEPYDRQPKNLFHVNNVNCCYRLTEFPFSQIHHYPLGIDYWANKVARNNTKIKTTSLLHSGVDGFVVTRSDRNEHERP